MKKLVLNYYAPYSNQTYGSMVQLIVGSPVVKTKFSFIYNDLDDKNSNAKGRLSRIYTLTNTAIQIAK